MPNYNDIMTINPLSNLCHDYHEWGMIQQLPLGQNGKKRKYTEEKALILQGKEQESILKKKVISNLNQNDQYSAKPAWQALRAMYLLV